jgi:hypothetical protein
MNSDDMRVGGRRPTGMWGTPIVSGTRWVRRATHKDVGNTHRVGNTMGAACDQNRSRFGNLFEFDRTLRSPTHALGIAAPAHAAGRTPRALHHFEGGAL